MSLKRTELNHGEILKVLKNDLNILSLIYSSDDELELESDTELDNQEITLKWNNELIKNAITNTTNISINETDEILMYKLRNFFNVDLAYEM